MKISDYELINNFEILFQKPLMLFNVNLQIKKILQDIKVIYKDAGEFTCAGEEYNCVLGKGAQCGQTDCYEYIFTSYGVKMAIAKHIRDKRFSEEVRNSFLKDVELYYRYGRVIQVAGLIKAVMKEDPDVMVYTAGKVGSSTMSDSLRKANLSCIQVESFFYPEHQLDKGIQDVWGGYCLEKIKKGIKIITIVREPIARGISVFMQLLMYSLVENDRSMQYQIVEGCLRHNTYPFEYFFDQELARVTGIDVFQYPFDREKGYGVIKENNFEVLLLTLEKLKSNKQVIQEFVGKPEFEFVSANVGGEKAYKHIYADVKKNLKIPYEIIEEIYLNNTRLHHFYTPEDIAGFQKKWEPNIEK